MRKFLPMAVAATLALTISACSDNDVPDADNVTETQMDDVDVIDGTISDEMVDVDTIGEADATDGAENAGSDETETSADENDADAAATAEN